MWFSDRRAFLGASLGFLTACGFEPAYGPTGGGSLLQNRMLVDEPTEFPGYLLTQNLEDKFGRTATPDFALSYAIEIEDESLSIAGDNVTRRYNKVGQITYALRSVQNKEVVTSGKVNSFTSYSATGTTVATVAAERDATKRLMVILSDQIATRLIAAAPGFAG